MVYNLQILCSRETSRFSTLTIPSFEEGGRQSVSNEGGVSEGGTKRVETWTESPRPSVTNTLRSVRYHDDTKMYSTILRMRVSNSLPKRKDLLGRHQS